MKPNPASRAQVLSTASRIFYTEGIHSVGIDRIVAEAQTTRATLYRHFPGKEELVLAYLEESDRAIRESVHKVLARGLTPADTVKVIAQDIAEGIRSPGFHGCAFLNAAAEFHNPGHPVNKAVIAHRDWFLQTMSGLLGEKAGRHFVMLRDGAMAAGCLFTPALVSETFLTGVDGLLS